VAKATDGDSERERKERVSRRGFLKTAAAGAAAAGVAATAPGLISGEIPLPAWSGGSPSRGGEPIVAYIGDASTGDIVLMAGERKVRIRDFGLVSRFLRAFSGV
jgi:TAT (twin-arginine translocation) pathway signal sequence